VWGERYLFANNLFTNSLLSLQEVLFQVTFSGREHMLRFTYAGKFRATSIAGYLGLGAGSTCR